MLKTTASNPFLKIAAPLSATFPSKPVNSGLDKAYTRPSPVHLHNSQLNTGYILPSYSLHERYPKGNGCTHLERHGSAPGIEMGFGWEQSSVDSFWSLPCEPQTFHACNPNFYGYLRQKRRQNFWVPTRCRWCCAITFATIVCDFCPSFGFVTCKYDHCISTFINPSLERISTGRTIANPYQLERGESPITSPRHRLLSVLILSCAYAPKVVYMWYHVPVHFQEVTLLLTMIVGLKGHHKQNHQVSINQRTCHPKTSWNLPCPRFPFLRVHVHHFPM